MATGIQICGLNGSGKSTLGKALAEALRFHFIDNEDLFFVRTSANEPYANPRTRDEVIRLLMEKVHEYPDFVFAAVRGDYGADIIQHYSFVIVVETPKDIRAQRVRSRSFEKFGARMQPGGDLYESEEAFFRMAAQRDESHIENWLKTLSCPIIRVNGTKPVAENIEFILQKLCL